MTAGDPLDKVNEHGDPSVIDRVFDPGASPDGTPEAGEPVGLEDLQELRDLCVRALRQESPVEAQLQARRVAQRVLKRTTREDLGRRGDLGVILEFIGDRLRDSMLLRVAVAALVVQVTIVPIVAWHLLTEPTRGGVRFVLEPSPEGIYDEVPAEEEPLGVVGGSRWWELDGAEAWLQADADFEGAAALLDQVRSALEAEAIQPSTGTGRALQGFTGIGGPDPSSLPLTVPSANDEIRQPIEIILDAERMLDQAQRGGTWTGLGDALEQVGETLTLALGAVDSAPPGPLAVLASRTLARALALGLMAPRPDPGLEVPGPDAWLLLIGEEAYRAAPTDGFVRAWRRVVREL